MIKKTFIVTFIFFLLGNKSVNAEKLDNLPTCTQGYLHQFVYRGDEGFFRLVPFANGIVKWKDAFTFRPHPKNLWPGSGSVQSSNTFQNFKGRLDQTFIRGGKVYTRNITLDPITGNPIWSTTTNWKDETRDFRVAFELEVGRDFLDRLKTFVQFDISNTDSDKRNTSDGFWIRNTGGFIFKYKDGVKQDLTKIQNKPSELPGIKGDVIQTQDGYIVPGSNYYQQSIFVDNIGYSRNVPIKIVPGLGRVINWKNAPDFKEMLNLNTNPKAIPGTGELKAVDSFVVCK